MPSADLIKARVKTPLEQLGSCQAREGCGEPGQYEHVDANGKRWFFCGIHWHRAQHEQTSEATAKAKGK